MMTTLTTCSTLGRARSTAAMAHVGAPAHLAVAAHQPFQAPAAPTTVFATNPWRDGDVSGSGSDSKKYATTRITPGRLEGVT